MEHASKCRRSQSPLLGADGPDAAPDVPQDAKVLPKCHLTHLPLELIAEVLSHVPSTRDVLAVARTSKHFFTILVNNNANDFIWRRARERCQPQPIPDPTPDFTEASYAVFIFDSKTCEVCQKRTKEMYYSFSLRARICDKPKCCNTWRSRALRRVSAQDKVEHPEFLHWLPQLDRKDENLIFDPFEVMPLVREDEWQQAVNEHKKAHFLGEDAVAAYVKKKQAEADLMPAKKDLCKILISWSRSYEKRRKEILQQNLETASTIAQEQQWSVRDLLQTPTYSLLHHSRNRSLEAVTQTDIDAILKCLTTEIAANKVRKVHREKEQAQQDRLKQVRSKWDDMYTRTLPSPVLPHLGEFRKLPVVKIYEAGHPNTQQHTLQDPFVASVLAENLEQWRDAARAGLAAVLGFPGWKNLSKRKLHPVDRLTARFRCKRCDAAAMSRKKAASEDGGMDFAAACKHVCAHLPKKRTNKEKWSADRFVPDQRAVDAISQVLVLCGTKPEDVESIQIADELGDRVQCQSCSCIMDVRSVDRHCKRHIDCSYTLANATVDPPIEHSLTKKLMKISRETIPEREAKVFVCRHCAKPHSPPSAPNSPRLMTFNALISHTKAKHLIMLLADEDFYRQKDTSAIDNLA